MPWKQHDVMHQKEAFVMAVLREEAPFVELCRQFKISTVTGYYWRDRFLAEGRAGLLERSRRPKAHPCQLKEEVICELVRLKHQHPSFGPEKVATIYQRIHGAAPSLSSIKRVFARAGLVKPRRVRLRRDPGAQPAIVHRPCAPNQLWTVDFKGWWRTSEGRCEPLTVRDGYSRFVLGVQAMATTRTDAVKPLFERWFEQFGLPDSIHTDNGSPFASTSSPLGLSRLSAWWTVLGIRLSRSRPGHPQDNGGHERMHRDLEDCVQPLVTQAGASAQALLEQWQHEFNHIRPHRALQMRCPHELYQPSPKRYQGTPQLIDYGPEFTSRMVSAQGVIRLFDRPYFLSSALAGWNVGLKRLDHHQLEVWFDSLTLGLIDTQLSRFIWARPHEAPVS